ncbi:protein kinase domain-containing protein [Ktedonobacter robiniae]|uniref:serine/threonine-protein kinase n=1 Tax=Ktedonobacter robiniae TaxID=2778365 RepID=UPI0019169DF4|nr:serine/threonine-protein kinase [Ktedonobacter robiniae]
MDALLSKGGYAAVFRGVDRNLSRYIAIKVLLPSRTTNSEHEHFLREARIAATLDHQNIAPVLDYGRDGPSVFLVMPLYTAGSLRTRLAQANGPLPLSEAKSSFLQLAGALSYAHTRPRPVIHRDIKPENILLHQDDHRLVITDFGIARALEPGERVGRTVTVRGTVGYMAPEQTSGVVDPRSDQYGSAIVLYELLTGYHPLDPAGGTVPPVSSLNPDLPQALDEVVTRAMTSKPDSRFSDMQQFMQAFEQAFTTSTKIQRVRYPVPPQQVQPEAHTQPTSRSTPRPSSAPLNISNTGKHQSAPLTQRRSNASTLSITEKCQEGDRFLEQQHYSQALQAYEEALGMDPLNFYAWNGKGTALYNQGYYRKALDAYLYATEIDSGNAVVWVSAGLVLMRLQRYQQALVHFERALSLDAQYVAAWNGKGDAQLDMNLPEEALASYQQALALDPRSFQAWNGLGNVHSSLLDYTGAVDAYTRALTVNPRSAVAWCNKAEALSRLGHNRAALDALNEATEMDKGYTRAWLLKAEVYESLGNTQEAQKARKRARAWSMKA